MTTNVRLLFNVILSMHEPELGHAHNGFLAFYISDDVKIV